MRTLFALFVSGLLWQGMVRAVELPLNGNPVAVTLSGQSEAVVKALNPTVHLNLGGSEDGSDLPLNLPAVSLSLVQPAAVAAAPATGASPAADWVNTGSVQALTLDARPKARMLSNLGTALPVSIPANSGTPDSLVYAVLGLLLVAMAWACSGWTSRRPSRQVLDTRGERRSKRRERVRMVPLNVNR